MINDKKYLDGGLADSIPLEFMQKQGYDKNLVILTQPIDYVKSAYKTILTVPLQNMPNIARTVKDRHIMYNAQTAYVKAQKEKGNAFIICPPGPLNIGSLERDANEMQRVYDIGRKTAEENLEEITSFFDKS